MASADRAVVSSSKWTGRSTPAIRKSSSIVLQQPSGPLGCAIDDQAAIELAGGIELIGRTVRNLRAIGTATAQGRSSSRVISNMDHVGVPA
jgi:hypothetical protein